MNLNLVYIIFIFVTISCQSSTNQSNTNPTQSKEDLLNERKIQYKKYDSLKALYDYFDKLAMKIMSHKMDSLRKLDTDKYGKLKLNKLIHVSISSTLNKKEKAIYDMKDSLYKQYKYYDSVVISYNKKLDTLFYSKKK